MTKDGHIPPLVQPERGLRPGTGAPGPGEVLLWEVEIGDNPPTADEIAPLSEEEQARLQAFRAPAALRAFARMRLALRHILADCLGETPDTLKIVLLPSGKPVLSGDSGIHFSLSHTGKRGLIAICHGVDIGVDIEITTEDRDLDAVARRFFLPKESAWLAACNALEKRARFYEIWTSKEALLKARGDGLRGLEALDIGAAEREGYQLVRFHLDEDVAAACAVRGVMSRWRLGRWSQQFA